MAVVVRDMVIRVRADAKGAKKALDGVSTQLDKFFKSMNKTRGAGSSLGRTIRNLAVGFLSFTAAMRGARFVKDTIVTFDSLEAQLQVVEGSLEGAKNRFSELADFSRQTPFLLENVTKAFINLKARGTQPTIEDMRVIGDVAAARGQDISSFANAVAQATVREFEPLKRFGIGARVEGQKIALTFEGVTKKVDKDAKSIKEALIDLGKTEFAGATELQARTLGGTISILKDNIKLFVFEIGRAGLTDALRDIVMEFTSLFVELDENGKVVSDTKDRVKEFAQEIGERASETVKKFIDRIKELKEEMEPVVDRIDQIVDAVGGWMNIWQTFRATIAGGIIVKTLIAIASAAASVGAFLAGAFAGLPIGAAVASLIGFVAQLAIVIAAIDEFIVTFKGGDSLINRARENWPKALQRFKEEFPAVAAFMERFKGVVEEVSEAVEAFKETFIFDALVFAVDVLTAGLEILGSTIVFLFNSAVEQAKLFFDFLMFAGGAAINTVVGFFEVWINIVTGMLKLLSGDFEGAMEQFGEAAVAFKDGFIQQFELIRDFVTDVFEFIFGRMEDFSDLVAGPIGEAISGLLPDTETLRTATPGFGAGPGGGLPTPEMSADRMARMEQQQSQEQTVNVKVEDNRTTVETGRSARGSGTSQNQQNMNRTRGREG